MYTHRLLLTNAFVLLLAACEPQLTNREQWYLMQGRLITQIEEVIDQLSEEELKCEWVWTLDENSERRRDIENMSNDEKRRSKIVCMVKKEIRISLEEMIVAVEQDAISEEKLESVRKKPLESEASDNLKKFKELKLKLFEHILPEAQRYACKRF